MIRSMPPQCTSTDVTRDTMNAAKHTHHDNGGAARDWKVLSLRPPLRGAMTFGDMPRCIAESCHKIGEKWLRFSFAMHD
jgi:hypothetical protein